MSPPWRRRPDPAEVLDDVAGAVDRLAALVLAGAGPDVAWRYLGDSAETPELAGLAAAAADAARAGRPLRGSARGRSSHPRAWLGSAAPGTS